MDNVSEAMLALQQRLYHFEDEVRRERQSTDRKIKDIEGEKGYLERKIMVIEADNKELNTEVRKLNTKARKLNTEVKKLNTEVRRLKEQNTELITDTMKNTATISAIRRRIILDDAKAKLIKRYPGVSSETFNPNHYEAQSSRVRMTWMVKAIVSVE
ncbi:hypothetical protein M405DRAFT_933489 [Rhizopogon salebrosus TDB-379]|nr:hypothetical protein M405DRAFT_933489 [Rhizopogon salebrosus TDB-379]